MATLVITLHKTAKPLSKFGFMLRGVLFFIGIATLIYLGIALSKSLLFLSMMAFASVFVLLFLSKRYFEKTFITEKIVVTYSKMTIIYRTFFKETKHEFLLRDVHYLGFAGSKTSTSQEASEKEIVILVDNGTIELETEKKIFRFGKNSSSLEAAELIRKIEEHLGRKFLDKHTELLYS